MNNTNKTYQVGATIDHETLQILDYIGKEHGCKRSEVVRLIIQCAIVDIKEPSPDYEYHYDPVLEETPKPHRVKTTLCEADHTNFIDLMVRQDTTISKFLRIMIAVQVRDYVLSKRQEEQGCYEDI